MASPAHPSKKPQDVEMAEAFPAPPPPVDVTEVKGDVPFFAKRRKLFSVCCASLACLIVVLGIVILALSLTIFKVKQPVINIDDIRLNSLALPSNFSIANLDIKLTLQVSVSVYNPNHASFRYTNSTSYMYYRDLTIGEAPIPAGKIGARGMETLDTLLRLNASSSLLTELPNLLNDLSAGAFPLSTSTQVTGRVNVLNIFKHHAHSSSSCTMFISIVARAVQNMTCTSHVKLA